MEIPDTGDAGGRVPNRRAPLSKCRPRAATLLPGIATAQRVTDIPDSTKDLYPAKRNEKYGSTAVRSRRRRSTATTINSTNSARARTSLPAAQGLKIRPWMVKIRHGGEAVRDRDRRLIRKMPLRSGLSPPLRRGVVDDDPVERLPDEAISWRWRSPRRRRNTSMQTFQDNSAPASVRVGIHGHTPKARRSRSQHELTFLVTGMYGKPAPEQMGAPPPAVPWKTASIGEVDVRFNFTDQRPKTFGKAFRRPNMASGPT
jgi:sulfoxide reductase catalytic subunit YedY